MSILSGGTDLLIGLLVVIAAALGLYAKGRSDGGKKVKAKIDRENAKARQTGVRIDDDIARTPAAENREDLRRWSRD